MLIKKYTGKILFKFILCLLANFFLFYLIPLEALEGIIEHRQGSGIGYKNQYSKIEIFHAFDKEDVQPFIDLRYLLLDHGKSGGNLGAGLGYEFSKANRLSLYTYFDLTQSKNNHLFYQVAPGLSYTHPLVFSGKDWGECGIYLNTYFPFSSKEKKVRAPSFAKFQGHHLLIFQTGDIVKCCV